MARIILIMVMIMKMIMKMKIIYLEGLLDGSDVG